MCQQLEAPLRRCCLCRSMCCHLGLLLHLCSELLCKCMFLKMYLILQVLIVKNVSG